MPTPEPFVAAIAKGPPHSRVPPPQRTAPYLETVVADQARQIAELQARHEHDVIELTKLRNQATVKYFRDEGYTQHAIPHEHKTKA